MRLLLDTHIALWAILGSPRITGTARGLIANPDHRKFVSVVSLWEIALKRTKHPAFLDIDVAEVRELLREATFGLLDVNADHAVAFERLAAQHGDPFDRMIAAQALSEPLILITHDKVLARYSETFILI